MTAADFTKVFEDTRDNKVVQWVFINPDKTAQAVINGNFLLYAVGFPERTYPGEGNVEFPAIYDDYTSKYCNLIEIPFSSVPTKIKRRFNKWLKQQ